MNRIAIAISIFALLATAAPVIAAETADRLESLPDAYPECMDRNGPQCVLRSEVMPPRVAAPPVAGPPSGVVVVPAPAPPGAITPPGMAVPSGLQGPPELIVPTAAAPIATAPGATVIIAPVAPAQSSTVISPRR